MKRLLHRPRERPEQATPSRITKTSTGGVVGRAVLSGLLMLAPLSKAGTEQPAPKQETCMEGEGYNISGKKVILHSDTGGVYGCLVYSKDNLGVVLDLMNPATFTVNFYPFVNFGDGKKVKGTVIYDLEGKTGVAEGVTAPSNLRIKGFELPPGWKIGMPISLTFSKKKAHKAKEDDPLALVPLTPQKITMGIPNGVVVLMKAEGDGMVGPRPSLKELNSEPASAKPPVPAEKPEKKTKVAEKTPSEKPRKEPLPSKETFVSLTDEGAEAMVKEANETFSRASIPGPLVETSASTEEETATSPLLSFEFERVTLSNLGKHKNSGNINDIKLFVMPPLSDSLALMLGASAGVHNLSADTADMETRIKLIFASLEGGVRYVTGNHTIFGTVYGGLSYITPEVISKLGLPASEYALWDAEFGGRAGYDYAGIAGFVIQGGNNPFNPALGRIYASVPGWVEDESLRLDVDARWLHLISQNTEGVPSGELDHSNILTRANLKIPLVRLGPVVPSAMAAFELNASSEGTKTDGYFGGALSLMLGLVRLEAAYLHSINGNHTVIVKGVLSR